MTKFLKQKGKKRRKSHWDDEPGLLNSSERYSSTKGSKGTRVFTIQHESLSRGSSHDFSLEWAKVPSRSTKKTSKKISARLINRSGLIHWADNENPAARMGDNLEGESWCGRERLMVILAPTRVALSWTGGSKDTKSNNRVRDLFLCKQVIKSEVNILNFRGSVCRFLLGTY